MRGHVIHENAVLVMLVAFGDIGTQQLAIGTLSFQLARGGHADEIPADSHHDMPEFRAFSHPDPLGGMLGGATFLFLHGNDGEISVRTHLNFHSFGEIATAGVLEHHGAAGLRCRGNEGVGNAQFSFPRDVGDDVRVLTSIEGHDMRALESRPGEGSRPVVGFPDGPQARIGAVHFFHTGTAHNGGGHGGIPHALHVLNKRGYPIHRRETPIFFLPGSARNRELLRIKGGEAIRAVGVRGMESFICQHRLGMISTDH